MTTLDGVKVLVDAWWRDNFHVKMEEDATVDQHVVSNFITALHTLIHKRETQPHANLSYEMSCVQAALFPLVSELEKKTANGTNYDLGFLLTWTMRDSLSWEAGQILTAYIKAHLGPTTVNLIVRERMNATVRQMPITP